jgi:hypothetical protein
MAHRSVHPLVFCHSKLKLSNMIISQVRRYRAILVFTDLSLLLVYWKMKPPSRGIYCVYLTVTMAPVVRIEPNGCQALLSHDDAINDLQAHGWDIFIQNSKVITWRSHRPLLKCLMGLEPKLGMCNWRSQRTL